jgi:PAS domain S-box-containing protein
MKQKVSIILKYLRNIFSNPGSEREQKILASLSLMLAGTAILGQIVFGIPEIIINNKASFGQATYISYILIIISLISYRCSYNKNKIIFGSWLLMGSLNISLYFLLFVMNLWYPVPAFFILSVLIGAFLLPWQVTIGFTLIDILMIFIAYQANPPLTIPSPIAIFDLPTSMALGWLLALSFSSIVGVYISYQLKQTVYQKEAQNERLDVTLRSINEGVIAINQNGEIILINKVAEELIGLSQEKAYRQLISQRFREIFEQSGPSLDCIIERVLKNKEIVELNKHGLLIETKGIERIITGSISPTLDSQNNVVGAVIVLKDVTLEQKITNELFNASKLESIGTLAGVIAHDFNNILTTINGNLEIARRENKDVSERLEALDEVTKAVYRAGELSRQLLTFSKGGEPNKEMLDLAALVRETALKTAIGTNTEIEVKAEPGLGLIKGDKRQLAQVVQNLVENAIQAQMEGRKVLINIENVTLDPHEIIGLPEGCYTRVSIRDWGVGIPTENIERIFDPFFTTKKGNKGLGLTTAFSIIKKHSGNLVYNKAPLYGSIFSFFLPLTSIQNTPVQMERDSSPEIKLMPRILIMDDEVSILKMVSKVLQKRGYQVHTAEHGEDAIKQYREAIDLLAPYDVVIMDLTIPNGLGGKEAIQKLRAIDRSARVIVSSGYSDDPVIARYWEFGFDGVVVKPYSLNELISAIEKLVIDSSNT